MADLGFTAAIAGRTGWNVAAKVGTAGTSRDRGLGRATVGCRSTTRDRAGARACWCVGDGLAIRGEALGAGVGGCGGIAGLAERCRRNLRRERTTGSRRRLGEFLLFTLGIALATTEATWRWCTTPASAKARGTIPSSATRRIVPCEATAAAGATESASRSNVATRTRRRGGRCPSVRGNRGSSCSRASRRSHGAGGSAVSTRWARRRGADWHIVSPIRFPRRRNAVFLIIRTLGGIVAVPRYRRRRRIPGSRRARCTVRFSALVRIPWRQAACPIIDRRLDRGSACVRGRRRTTRRGHGFSATLVVLVVWLSAGPRWGRRTKRRRRRRATPVIHIPRIGPVVSPERRTRVCTPVATGHATSNRRTLSSWRKPATWRTASPRWRVVVVSASRAGACESLTLCRRR